ncbi:MAG: hypothetical protein KGJ89_01650 [Patescibacteria group bacterium]|nr:hypothetical protein [Patescibacteria group bacterium]MDE2015213.1 hypothetical protein [Patescibacteria group bacterium]MDE2226640.1 hypothetical protein [Patescibacteria group bacterium]
MAHFLTDLGLLASQNQFLAYFIIYITTIFLGNISAFASFWVILKLPFGTWGVPFLMLTILLSNISGDLLWYSLGKTLRDTRFGNFIRNRLPGHDKIEEKLHKSGTKWMFMSKFMYASAFPVIFSVGWFGVKFKKFIRVSMLSALVWLPVLTGLAYGLFASLSPLGATSIFKRFEILFIIGLGVFFVADYFISRLFGIIFRNSNGLYGASEEVESDGNVNGDNLPGYPAEK